MTKSQSTSPTPSTSADNPATTQTAGTTTNSTQNQNSTGNSTNSNAEIIDQSNDNSTQATGSGINVMDLTYKGSNGAAKRNNKTYQVIQQSARIIISKVQANGQFTVRIIASQGIPALLDQIKNTSFSITIPSKGNMPVNYTFVSKDEL